MNSLIETKEELKSILEYEKGKYGRISPCALIFPITEKDFLWKYNWLLRHLEYHINKKNIFRRILYKIVFNRYSARLGIQIPPNTCRKGLKIMHVGPILINGKARIGEDVSIHINTAVVADGVADDVPTLGNGVVLGVGAVVLGDVRLADNIAVGANAVVNKSFAEENIAIAGVPAKKISNNGRKVWAGVEERKEN